MNRRKFLKYLGFGSAVAVAPAIAKPAYESSLTVVKNTYPEEFSDALKYKSASLYDRKTNETTTYHDVLGPEMTATEVLERRAEFAKNYNSSFYDSFSNMNNKS